MSPKCFYKTHPAMPLLCLLALASVLSGLSPSLLFASEKDPKQVLVLHSYHVGLNWTDDVMAGIRDIFSQQPTPPRIYVEYMDSKRNPSPEYLSQVLDEFLTRKFKGKRFDLVLLSDNNALNFVRRHRGDLFAGVPIVFCGINNFTPSMIEGMGAITGVAELPEVGKTIDLALKLHPGIEEIIFIGRTDVVSEKLNDKMYRAAAREFEGRVTVRFWNDLPLEELQARLHRLGPDRIVFSGGVVKTAAGQVLSFAESSRKLREASEAPLYSFWDTHFGEGFIGGKLITGRAHGRLAAQLAVRILAGENSEAIEVVTSESNPYMFDYRELKRFKISLKALPEGSQVKYGPPPFYEISKQQLWAFLVFMTVLTVALLVTMLGRLRAVKALRISEERFRSVFNSSPMGMHQYRLEPDGRLVLTEANPAADVALGVENQAFIGLTIEEAFPSLVETELPDRCREACTLGRSWHTEHLAYEDQNIKGVFEVYVFPTEPGMMAGMFSDITERKQAEEALQSAHRQLQDIIEFLPDATFVIDRDKKVVAWNRAMEELTDMPKEKILGLGNGAYAEAFFGHRRPLLIDLMDEPDPEVEETYDLVERKNRTIYAEGFVPSLRQGRGAYLWGKATALLDRDGNRVGAIESLHDITERKQAEEALQAAHRQLQDIIDFLPDATFVIDRDKKVVAWNRAMERMTGVPKEEMIGQGDYAYAIPVYGERRPVLLDLIESPELEEKGLYDVIGKQGEFVEQYLPLVYGGKGAYVWATASRLFDRDGNFVGAIESVRDISDRKEASDRLETANRELEAFVYTVSHDLRSPLTPIIGYADYLRESCRERLNEQELHCLSEISGSGQRMVGLLEDLLTLAKVGKVDPPAGPLDPGEIVTEVLRQLTRQLSRAGVTVAVGDLPALRISKTLLFQVFDNLISNALHYGCKTGDAIEVGGERRGERVRLYVRDHGPGIPVEERGRIFEVFYRGTTGKDKEGTGIGLATIQKIARHYDGRAWVEETPGGGSTFWVEMMDVETAAEEGEDTL